MDEPTASANEREAEPRIDIGLADGSARTSELQLTLSRRDLELFAAVALSKRTSTDALLDLLWPDDDPALARVRFKVSMCRIRRRLGRPDAFALASGRWTLGRHVRVDLVTCEAAGQAGTAGALDDATRIDLYDALQTLLLGPSPLFAGSVLHARVARAFDDATERIGSLLLGDAFARGDAARATTLAQSLIAVDPYAERWHDALVRAHVSARNLPAARAAVVSYARLLNAELGEALPPTFERLLA